MTKHTSLFSRVMPSLVSDHARSYARMLLSFVFASVTQPMLGIADTAVMGRFADAAHIAGVGVGAVIFSTLYWLLGFLRVGVTGLSAQNHVERSPQGAWKLLLHSCALALFFAGTILLLQRPLFWAAMQIMRLEQEAVVVVVVYYDILIWGAPLVLLNYVLLGWLMGQSLLRAALMMQVGGNILNIVLDVVFVGGLAWGVQGVAWASVIANLYSCIVGVYFITRALGIVPHFSCALHIDVFVRLIRINGHLFLRTICLLVQTNMFMATSSGFGTITLSANAVLVQIMLFFACVYEGIANTTSVWAGKAVASGDRCMLQKTRYYTFYWTLGVCIGMTMLYIVFSSQMLSFFTDIASVLSEAQHYAVWGGFFPFCAAIGLTWYGFFTGTSVTLPVFLSTLCALCVFILIWFVCVPHYGNNGLWIAYLTFYLGRSVFILPWWNYLYRHGFMKDV